MRRVFALYLLWMLIGFGTYIYMYYYPILLEEPVLNLESKIFIEPVYSW